MLFVFFVYFRARVEHFKINMVNLVSVIYDEPDK